MAISYNRYDKVYYGTDAERTGAEGDKIKVKATAKFYTYDTGILYVSDGTTWHEVT